MRDWPMATAGWFRRLYERVSGAPAGDGDGTATLMTGGAALLTLESMACDALCRLSDDGAASGGLVDARNAFGRPLDDLRVESPRAVVASAVGAAAAGRRVAAFVAGDRLAEVHDQLFAAAGRHVPLVVHASNRAMPRQASARGSGHEGYHAVADCGAFLLMARSAQEAVDLALVARVVAERALVPGVVAIDGPETTWAPQDVRMPDPGLVEALLGAASESVEPSSEAQRMLFGHERRRAPALIDPVHPVASGAAQDDAVFGAGVLGQRAFFAAPLPAIVDEALERVGAALGRPLSRVAWYGPERADHVFVVQGSAAEVARAAVDLLNRTRGESFAVMSPVWLRPFPVAAINEALRHARSVVVLERVDEGLAAAPPLARELLPITDALSLRLASVTWGAGGQAAGLDDLVWLGRRVRAGEPISGLALGVSLPDTRTRFPRRQARATAIARSFPALQGTVGGADEAVTLDDTTRIVQLVVPTRDARDELAIELARAASGELFSHVRSRVTTEVEGTWTARVCASRTSEAPVTARLAHVLLLDAPDLAAGRDPFADVVEGGVVLLGDRFADLDATVHPRWRTTIAARGLRVARVEGGADALIATLARAYATPLGELEPVALGGATEPLADDGALPMVVRRVARTDTRYDNPARSWGEVVQPLLAGEHVPAGLDPYLTLGAVPPGTSTFHDGTPGRAQLPVLDPDLCTGCGRCWTVCPDSALAPVALPVSALLSSAAASVGFATPGARRLERAFTHLASRAEKLLSERTSTRADGALEEALAWLLPKLDVPAEERADFDAAFAATLEVLRALPSFATAKFFRAGAAGDGNLLSIALNPRACKGCGGCVEACADGALRVARQTPDLVATATAGWAAWEALPDTQGTVIAKAGDAVGPLAATFLSRHASTAVAGGDAAEPGSGARLALRLVLGVAEPLLQTRHNELVTFVAALEERARTAMQTALSAAIHTENSAAVVGALSDARASKPNGAGGVAALVAGLAEAGAVDAIDTTRLEALARLSDRLAEERARLMHGPNGLGRSRLALVVAEGPETDWAVRHPYNPFSVPVSTAPAGDAPEFATGVQRALLSDAVALARLVRRTEVLVDAPKDLRSRLEALEAIGWSEVPDAVTAAATPVVVVGGAGALLRRGLGGLDALLAGSLPIRVVILDELEPGALADPMRVAMMHEGAFAASVSIAHPDHLASSVRRAFSHPGPSLLHVHVPSPGRHGFATEWTVAQAQIATLARVHPLAVWDPGAGASFAARLDLSANPAPGDDLARDGSGKPIEVSSWTLTERRFADLPAERLERVRERVAARWRVLRELSGTLEGAAPVLDASELEARLEQVRVEASAARDAAVVQAVAAVRAEQATDLRDRLLRLAGYAPSRPRGEQ